MNIRTFRPAVIGFVHIVREKHPDTPLVVISPIFSPPRETTPNAAESTLTQMRVEVVEAVDAMQDRGDTNLHYVNGLDLFGPDLAHLLPDDLHPNAEGYKVMGQNFVDRVVQRYFSGVFPPPKGDLVIAPSRLSQLRPSPGNSSNRSRPTRHNSRNTPAAVHS